MYISLTIKTTFKSVFFAFFLLFFYSRLQSAAPASCRSRSESKKNTLLQLLRRMQDVFIVRSVFSLKIQPDTTEYGADKRFFNFFG